MCRTQVTLSVEARDSGDSMPGKLPIVRGVLEAIPPAQLDVDLAAAGC